MFCSFSSTVARICFELLRILVAQHIEALLDRCAHAFQPLLVRLGELGDPIGNLSHLLVLNAGDALELVAHRLRLLSENRAELGSHHLACQRLLGARVGQILAHIALEIGAGRGEHLEPRAHIRCLPNRGIARARQRLHANKQGDDEESDDDECNDDNDREGVRHGGRVYYAVALSDRARAPQNSRIAVASERRLRSKSTTYDVHLDERPRHRRHRIHRNEAHRGARERVGIPYARWCDRVLRTACRNTR